MRSWLALTFVALGLSACATPYQPEGYRGGFSELQLSRSAWRVEFRGNGYTRPARASDFALLRATELVLAAGCTHYEVVSARTGSEYGGTVVNAHAYGATAVPIRKPGSAIAVGCASPDVGVDARETASRLRAKYSLD